MAKKARIWDGSQWIELASGILASTSASTIDWNNVTNKPTEISYLTGVTSSIQNQIDSKLSLDSASANYLPISASINFLPMTASSNYLPTAASSNFASKSELDSKSPIKVIETFFPAWSNPSSTASINYSNLISSSYTSYNIQILHNFSNSTTSLLGFEILFMNNGSPLTLSNRSAVIQYLSPSTNPAPQDLAAGRPNHYGLGYGIATRERSDIWIYQYKLSGTSYHYSWKFNTMATTNIGMNSLGQGAFTTSLPITEIIFNSIVMSGTSSTLLLTYAYN